MNLLDLTKLGPRETSPGIFHFGLLLPDISPDTGNHLFLKIIHESDQFLQKIPPKLFPLQHSIDPEYGDYWSSTISIKPEKESSPESSWGSKGKYVYRYFLINDEKKIEIDWIIDPFAREYGTGKLSAVTMGYSDHEWDETEKNWKTPELSELIVYELMISEFAGSIQRAIKRLDYLADLGITCVEIMPVSNSLESIDWGFSPVGYFGVDERFGKRRKFQWFVNEAHKRGIAVIIDSVYAHTDAQFPYVSVYRQLKMNKYPITGPFAKDEFGESTDFHKKLTQDYFFSVNMFWLEKFHVDGFRYDYVPGYYDGPTGEGYANLVYSTYKAVKSNQNTKGHWQRFFNGSDFNFIQCAEQLEKPKEILEKTYTNCTWQDSILYSGSEVAKGRTEFLTSFGLSLGLDGFCEDVSVHGDEIKKSAIQYLENHDHARFICNFGLSGQFDNQLLWEGNREYWYKLQPYLIALFTAKGIPFLWQGEEFGENYYIPDKGWGRVKLFRPLRWDYFYSYEGKNLVSLVRKLIHIRKNNIQFRKGEHYFYNHHDYYQSKQVILFSRRYKDKFSCVALNFGNVSQTVPFWFPIDGNYHEELEGNDYLSDLRSKDKTMLTIPSNYGRIWTSE